MSSRRSLILLVIGAALGAFLATLLFNMCSEDDALEPDDIAETDGDDGPPSADTDSIAPVAALERDLTGDCVLSGSVISPDGSPAVDALVRVRLLDEPWATADLEVEETTDEEGLFSFEKLTKDAVYQLWAWSPGHAVTAYEDARCGAKTHLILEPGSSLTLEISTSEDEPAEGATVQLAGSALWPARTATAGPNGVLVITGLSEGFYVLRVTAGDQAHVSREPIEIGARDDVELKVRLAPAGSARVRVTSREDGKPVSGASVIVGPASTSMLQRSFVTGKDGTVQVTGLIDEDNMVTVSGEGYVGTSTRPIGPGDDLGFTLSRGGVISGLVKTGDGSPVQGATIRATLELGDSSAQIPSGRDRRFHRRMSVASLGGWPTMAPATEDDTVIAGPANIPIPALSPAGSPQSGTVDGAGGWSPTDAEGRFLVDGLAAGRISVSASHPELVPLEETVVTLGPGEHLDDVTVTMRPGTLLSVRVLNESGYPVRDAQVVVYDDSSNQVSLATSGNDGFARMAGLPGHFRVEASAPDLVTAAAQIRSREGEDMEVEIKLPPADKILRGRVTNTNGFGVEDISITARSITRGLVQVVIGNTQSDGGFSLEGVGSGSYHVTAEQEGKIIAQVGDAGHEDEIKLVLNEGGGPVPLSEPDFVSPGSFNDTLPIIAPGEAPGGDASGVIAISSTTDPTSSVNTQYGQADQLVVTGPPSGKGGLPITLSGGPGNVTVRSVQPGSLVAGAGLSPGDRILTVDGVKVKGPGHARQAIHGKIGTVVLMEVLHRGEHLSIVVQRVRVK